MEVLGEGGSVRGGVSEEGLTRKDRRGVVEDEDAPLECIDLGDPVHR